jgi:hypothetical protein
LRTVGDHLGAAIAERDPGVPSLGEKAEIFRTMNPCPRPLPEHHGLDQFVPARAEPGEQAIGAFGLLGGAPDHAANQKELRIVAAVQFRINGLHGNTPVAEDKIPPAFASVASRRPINQHSPQAGPCGADVRRSRTAQAEAAIESAFASGSRNHTDDLIDT